MVLRTYLYWLDIELVHLNVLPYNCLSSKFGRPVSELLSRRRWMREQKPSIYPVLSAFPIV